MDGQFLTHQFIHQPHLHSDQALNHAMKMHNTDYANYIKMRAMQMFIKFCKAEQPSTGCVLTKLINRGIVWFFFFISKILSHVLKVLMNPTSEEFTRLIRIDNEAVVRGFMNRLLDDRHFYQFAKYFIEMQLYMYTNRMVKSFLVIEQLSHVTA